MSALTRTLTTLILTCFCGALFAQGVDEDFHKPAEFRVTDHVVLPAEAHMPFGAESHPEHNILSHQAYEKIIHRTAYNADEDSPNEIRLDDPDKLTSYNSYGDGYWDGARARVYRMMDGKWVKVREDVVPEGGFSTAMWRSSGALGVGTDPKGHIQALVPEAREATFSWRSSWDGGRTFYLGVAAIDAAGNLSEINWAEVEIPEERQDTKKFQHKTKRFRAKGEDKTPPPAPVNVSAEVLENGSNATLTWDAENTEDTAGFITFYAIHHPDEHTGGHIRLSESPADPEKHIREGDHVVLELEAVNRLRSHVDPRLANVAKHNARRHYGFVYPDEDPNMDWRLLDYADFPDMPRPADFESLHSESFLRYTLKNGASAAPHNYSIGSIEDGRPTPKPATPYVAEIRVRYEGQDPNAKAVFRISGGVFEAAENAGEVLETSLQPTDKWQTARLEFTNHIPWHTDDYGNSAQWKLELRGDGIFDVDELRIYEKGPPFAGILWEDSLHEEAKAANMSVFRLMWLNEEGHKLINILHDFHQFLAYCEAADVSPFFAIQHYLNETEWRGLTAFLAEPYRGEAARTHDPEDPQYWAEKRAEYGRKDPWVDAFEMLVLQVNNQPYYSTFNPWAFVMPGPVDAVTGEEHPRGYAAGAMAEYCFNVMKSSPAWTPEMEEKTRLAIQIQSANVRHEEPQYNGYGVHSTRAAPSAGVVLSALYNGGWDGNPNNFTVANLNEGIFTSLAFNHTTNTNWAKNLPALREYMKDEGFWPEGAILGGYELGPGYQLPGPGMNQEIVKLENAVGKSLAVGTSTLDNFLTRAYHGTALQNYFMLKRRANFWSSHQEVAAGGQPYPMWLLLELWLNEAMPGGFVEVETLSVPTLDIPDLKRRGKVEDAPMVAVYATRDGDRYNVLVLSRKQDGTVDLNQDGDPDYDFGDAWTPVTLQLPFESAGKVTLHRMFGDPRENNIDAYNVKIETAENVAFQGGKIELTPEVTGMDRAGLPPACTALLVFEETR